MNCICAIHFCILYNLQFLPPVTNLYRYFIVIIYLLFFDLDIFNFCYKYFTVCSKFTYIRLLKIWLAFINNIFCTITVLLLLTCQFSIIFEWNHTSTLTLWSTKQTRLAHSRFVIYTPANLCKICKLICLHFFLVCIEIFSNY